MWMILKSPLKDYGDSLDFEIQRQTVTKLYLTQDNYLDCQQTWEFDVVLPPEVSGWFQRNSDTTRGSFIVSELTNFRIL